MSKIKIEKPVFSDVNLENKDQASAVSACMLYISENIDNKKRKSATIKWCSGKMEEADIKTLTEAPDLYFESVGKYCYIIENGGVFGPAVEENIMKSVVEQLDLYRRIKSKGSDADEDIVEKRNVIGIQDYLREKVSAVCGELDHMVDMFIRDPKKHDLSDVDIESMFVTSGLKSGHYRYVPMFYKSAINELKEVIAGEDVDLTEAYSFMTKPQIKKLLSFYENIVSISEHLKNSGVNRKPRAPRAININKASSKVNYMKEFESLKLKSVHPSKIFGSKEVWVYNTKTRKLGVYVSNDESGLSVKGTCIRNFSDKSVEKTIKSSTKIDLSSFSGYNRTAKKTKFKEINTIEVSLKGRINEHCVILSADK